MHIVKKFGEDTMPDWKIRWAVNKDGPFIHVNNETLKQDFGMTQPKSGYLDHANELAALRKRRDSGVEL